MTRPDCEPELAFHFFMQQLLYDAPNDAAGVMSAMRGHSLGRTMLGLGPQGFNSIPFSGTGRLHVTHPATAGVFSGADDYLLINYQNFLNHPVRDPEYAGFRANAKAPLDPINFVGGLNAPYTYPDLNNMAVAAVNAKGEILMQSIHRPWTGIGPLYYNPADPTSNQKWAANPDLIDPTKPGSD
jgi:hypothetical protein